MRVFGARRQNTMSIQKPQKKRMREEDEDIYQDVRQSSMPISLPLHARLPTGVNSTVSTYTIMETGHTGQNLWVMNMSTMPSEQKRLLSILGGSTFLVNYALDSYPNRLNIIINEVTPSVDDTGAPSHIAGVLVPQGGAVPVVNPGNIIGYNVCYKLLAPLPPIDITGIPLLTFDLTQNNGDTIPYPVASPIVAIIQVTNVMF